MLKSIEKRLGAILVFLLALIIIFEVSDYRPVAGGLVANTISNTLNLVRGAEKAQIQSGNYIIAMALDKKTILAEGKFIQMNSDSAGPGSLTIQQSDGQRDVSIEVLGALWQGRAKRTGRYAGVGGFAGLLVGGGIGASIEADFGGSGGGFIALCAAIDGAALGLTGALIGGAMHLAATEYPLSGSESWTFETDQVKPLTPSMSTMKP